MKPPKIDKSALTFGEPPRIRDPKWLASANGRQCDVPGCYAIIGVVGAHIRWDLAGGTSLRPCDSKLLFLCQKHHAEQEIGGAEWLARLVIMLCQERYRTGRGLL